VRRIAAALAIAAAALGAACDGEPTGTESSTEPTVPTLAELIGQWDFEAHCVSRSDCGYAGSGCGSDTLAYTVLGGIAFFGSPIDSSQWRSGERSATITAQLTMDGEECLDPTASCSGRGTGCYSQLGTGRAVTVEQSVPVTIQRVLDGPDSASADYRITFQVRWSGGEVASPTFEWSSDEQQPVRFLQNTDWYFFDLRRR